MALRQIFILTAACSVVALGSVCAQERTVQPARQPTIVEVFTSTNCPSCPATERKLNDLAAGRNDFMVVLEHVDYWNKRAKTPDPYAHPDFTQRQYDYSNRLANRPGEVFTPQPVLDGNWVASPPLWFNWSSTLESAQKEANKASLNVVRNGSDVKVSWPTSLQGQFEIVSIGLVKDEKLPNLWRATTINVVPAETSGQILSHATMPHGNRLLVMLQDAGGGRIRASGLMPLETASR